MSADSKEKGNENILLVAAHPLEVKELRKKLGFRGPLNPGQLENTSFDGTNLELFITGVGNETVESSLNSLFLRKNDLPKLLVNFGFAGALDDGIRLGDWILANEVRNLKSTSKKPQSLKLDFPIFKKVLEFFSSSTHPYHQGVLLTVEKPLTDSRDKRLLQTIGALAVDMEAYHIAEIALKFKVPVVSLKTVSDYADEKREVTLKSAGNKLSSGMGRVLFDFLRFLKLSRGQK